MHPLPTASPPHTTHTPSHLLPLSIVVCAATLKHTQTEGAEFEVLGSNSLSFIKLRCTRNKRQVVKEVSKNDATMGQHIIPVSQKANPHRDCCGFNQHVEVPGYTAWLAGNHVKRTDYAELVEPWVADANRIADRCVPYTMLSIVSCGLAGWWCQLGEVAAMNRRGQAAIEKFNEKYSNSNLRVDTIGTNLIFRKIERRPLVH